MAFKGAKSYGPSTVAALTHSVSIPADVAVGETLMLLLGTAAAATASATGWTQIFAESRVSASGQDRLTVLTRTADGTEGASVTVTLSSSQNLTAVCTRLGNVDAALTIQSSSAHGSDVSPNPPSLSPSWGLQDAIWIAVAITTGARTLTVSPANYDIRNFLLNSTQLTSGTAMGVSFRHREIATENPGPFTLASSFIWLTATFAVPISAADTGAYSRGIRRGISIGASQ